MNTESDVESFLQGVADEVIKIATGADKTPDYLVREGDTEYLIEVKDRYPNNSDLAAREELLSNGDIYESSTPRGYQNTISAIIRGGSKQLETKRSSTFAFKAIWITLHGRDHDLLLEQIASTLYGVKLLVDLDEVPLTSRKCFFYDFSEFYRCQDALDAVIVSDGGQAVFFLNSLSERLGAVRSSRLAKTFGNAVFHPEDIVSKGAAFTADDFNESRRDSAAVLKHVQAKYGRKRLTVLEPVLYTGEVRV